MLYYTTALRRCQALPAPRRRKMRPAGVSGGRKRQKARKNRLRPAAHGLSARQEAGISASEAAATRLAGPKNGSTPRCAVENIRGGKRVAVRSPRAWGQGRFSAGFVQTAAFCSAPARPDCRVVSRALRRWRFDPTAAAFLRLRADGGTLPACAPCPPRLPLLGFVKVAALAVPVAARDLHLDALSAVIVGDGGLDGT